MPDDLVALDYDGSTLELAQELYALFIKTANELTYAERVALVFSVEREDAKLSRIHEAPKGRG